MGQSELRLNINGLLGLFFFNCSLQNERASSLSLSRWISIIYALLVALEGRVIQGNHVSSFGLCIAYYHLRRLCQRQEMGNVVLLWYGRGDIWQVGWRKGKLRVYHRMESSFLLHVAPRHPINDRIVTLFYERTVGESGVLLFSILFHCLIWPPLLTLGIQHFCQS